MCKGFYEEGEKEGKGIIIGLLAAGHSEKKILKAYPYLEREDIQQALAYAAWRVEELDLPLEMA